MINRLHVISLTAIGSMSLAAAMITPRQAPVPVKPKVEATEQASMASSPLEGMLLKADQAGQFHVEAALNGAPVQFLIDTGADMVALTEDEAAGLGLIITPDQFQPILQTASGKGEAALVTLNDVEIGGVRLQNVDALVVKGLPINLLGQSVLKQFGSVEMRGNEMVLKPK